MRDKFYTVLFVVALAVAFVQTVRVGNAQELAERNRVRADSIAADAAIARLQADSVWEVRLATQDDDLQGRLASGDSARAGLAAELAEANVRVGLLAEVNATARGNIVSLGAQLSAAEAEARGLEADSATVAFGGDLDDGLLVGSWTFTLPRAEHMLAYDVSVPGELVVSLTGDGRTLVTARSTHERAALRLGEIFVDPPPPVEVRRLSFMQAGIAFLAGIVTWEFAR
jgi:hypothetical protein